MPEKQSRLDSWAEAVTNQIVGYLLAYLIWSILIWAMDLPIGTGQNLFIIAVFSVVSVARQYILRRIFTGKTVWQTLKDRFR